MRKLGYIVAALSAIAVVAPSIASAETVVIKRGHHHYWNDARAEMRMHRDYGWHRGWHRGWHEGWRHRGDRVVIHDHRY